MKMCQINITYRVLQSKWKGTICAKNGGVQQQGMLMNCKELIFQASWFQKITGKMARKAGKNLEYFTEEVRP